MKRILSRHSSERTFKASAFFVSLALLVTFAAGVTLAYLITKTTPVANAFTSAQVSCKVTEDFDGEMKKNVNVTNTSDINVYMRVKLVTYRVNENGEHIGGIAEIPQFDLGDGWVEHDGYYYYTVPVASGNNPEKPLIDEISLKASYEDADGGKQVIEVMAEAVQAAPQDAVHNAWGVDIQENGVSPWTSQEGE